MNAVDILKEQLAACERNVDHAVVTIVASDGSTPRTSGKMIVYADGGSKGTVGGGAAELLAIRDAKECIASGRNAFREYDLNTPASETGMACGGRLSVLIEAFVTRPLLVMCGAGHVGGAVMKLASFLGFETLLIDDRGESVIADKIALADRFIQVSDFEKDIRAMTLPAGCYAVIATHGHSFDGAALAGMLTKKCAYVGMIGSSQKIAALFGKLSEKGVTQKQLDSVYTPIGLDLGGETPEEIAVSILAEILMVKHGKTGGHMTGMEK